MGVWLMNRNPIRLSPEVDDDFILRFDSFCRSHYPFEESYGFFCPCPWYFNEKNELTAFSGKFAEVESWYELLVEDLFKPLGYKVIGDPDIRQDYEFPGFTEVHNSRVEESIMWEFRIIKLRRKEYDKRYKIDPFYSSTNQSFLNESIKSLKAGKGIEHDLIEPDETDLYGPFDSIEELMEDLNADD